MSAEPRFAPKMVYWITPHRPDGFKGRYRETGGGLFTRKQAAVDRGEYAVRGGRAEAYTIHESPCDWSLS